MLCDPGYMIPGMFFVTWEDMGTHCDKVQKIVGIFFCSNTFVLALTTMEKYNVRGNNRLVWKYWNTRTKLVWSEVGIRPTLSLNFELAKRGRAKILSRSLLLGYIYEWQIMCMQIIIIIISIATSREECSVNSLYPPHLEGEISHKLRGVGAIFKGNLDNSDCPDPQLLCKARQCLAQ